MRDPSPKIRRRDFLKTLTLAAAGMMGFPTIVPAKVLGRSGQIPPSDKIVMAGIGFGMMGIPNMEAFLNKDRVRWVAVCDLDDKPLARAKEIVDTHYGNRDCTPYNDFRELCQRHRQRQIVV